MFYERNSILSRVATFYIFAHLCSAGLSARCSRTLRGHTARGLQDPPLGQGKDRTSALQQL